MALFKVKMQKNPTQRVEQYAEAENTPAPQEREEERECNCESCMKLRSVLANQSVIVQNQQVIVDSIGALHKQMLELAQPVEEEEEEEEEEPPRKVKKK